MILTFELRAVDRLRHALYLHDHSPAQRAALAESRWFVTWWGLLAGLLVAAAARSWAGLVTACVFTLIGYAVYGPWARRGALRAVQRQLAMPEAQRALGMYTLEVLGEGLHYRSAAAEVRVPWASVGEIATTSGYTFVNIGAGAGLPIPRETVREGDFEAVARLMRERSAAAPGA